VWADGVHFLPLPGEWARVPTPPGKSWNCVCKISRTWKVLENELGPGKSWNSLGSDADAVMQAAGAEQLLNFFLQELLYMEHHVYNICKKFLCYFFATWDSDVHIPQYGCCCLSRN